MLLMQEERLLLVNHSLQQDEKTPAITDHHRRVSPQCYTENTPSHV